MYKHTQVKIVSFRRIRELEDFINEFSRKNKVVKREIKIDMCKDKAGFILILDYEVIT